MPLPLMILAGVAGLVPARWNSGDPKSLGRLGGDAVVGTWQGLWPGIVNLDAESITARHCRESS